MLVISGDDDSVLAAAADNKHLLVFEMLPDHPERRPHVLLLPRAQLAVSAETPGEAITGLGHSVTYGGPTRHLDHKESLLKMSSEDCVDKLYTSKHLTSSMSPP